MAIKIGLACILAATFAACGLPPSEGAAPSGEQFLACPSPRDLGDLRRPAERARQEDHVNSLVTDGLTFCTMGGGIPVVRVGNALGLRVIQRVYPGNVHRREDYFYFGQQLFSVAISDPTGNDPCFYWYGPVVLGWADFSTEKTISLCTMP